MFLAVVAILSATLAAVMAYLAARQGGTAGVWFMSSVAAMLAMMSAGLALLLAAILFARRDPARPVRAVFLSLAALAVAGGYLALV
jgi:hypothetical protein